MKKLLKKLFKKKKNCRLYHEQIYQILVSISPATLKKWDGLCFIPQKNVSENHKISQHQLMELTHFQSHGNFSEIEKIAPVNFF